MGVDPLENLALDAGSQAAQGREAAFRRRPPEVLQVPHAQAVVEQARRYLLASSLRKEGPIRRGGAN